MPQPKSSSQSSRSSGRAGRAGGGRKKSTSAKRTRATGKASSGSGSQRAGGRRAASSKGQTGDTSAAVRELINPVTLMTLTRDRVQETLNDAVKRGRVTADDAEELLAELVRRGRKQTEDLLAEIEELVDGQRTASRQARASVRRAVPTDRVMREVDRARRATGLGPSFPISGYDDLAAGQVIDRLDDLKSAELRKVRDHERRHANRKTVLAAIERKLAE